VTKNKVWIQLTENLLTWQRPLRDRKNNYASIIYGECSTISANFVKIGQLGVEIIGLKEITTIFLNTSETYSPPSASSKPGGLKKGGRVLEHSVYHYFGDFCSITIYDAVISIR